MLKNTISSTISLLITGCLSISSVNSFAGSSVFEPASVADYVKNTHLIVIAHITGIGKIHKFYGYQANAAERQSMEEKLIASGQSLGISFAIPMVDYEVTVDEVLKPDTRAKNSIPTKLVLRLHQSSNTLFSSANAKSIAGKQLIFLSRNPDGASYGLLNESMKLNLDANNQATFNRGDSSVHVLDGKYMNADFVQEIRDEIARSKSIGSIVSAQP